MVEAHAHVVLGLELLDLGDVRHGGARQEAVAVAGGEGVAVLAEEIGPLLLAEVLDQGVVEVVRPGAGRLDEALLDGLGVVVWDLVWLRVDDEVEAREHGLREPDVELDVRAAQGPVQDALHPLPDLRVVAVARHEDQAREEAPVGVAAHEEPHALALLEVEDAHRDLEELFLGNLEQLVARVGLEDLDEVLLVVAVQWEARALEDVPDLAAHQWNLQRARAVGREGVQTQETPLAGDFARRIELLDTDVV